MLGLAPQRDWTVRQHVQHPQLPPVGEEPVGSVVGVGPSRGRHLAQLANSPLRYGDHRHREHAVAEGTKGQHPQPVVRRDQHVGRDIELGFGTPGRLVEADPDPIDRHDQAPVGQQSGVFDQKLATIGRVDLDPGALETRSGAAIERGMRWQVGTQHRIAGQGDGGVDHLGVDRRRLGEKPAHQAANDLRVVDGRSVGGQIRYQDLPLLGAGTLGDQRGQVGVGGVVMGAELAGEHPGAQRAALFGSQLDEAVA